MLSGAGAILCMFNALKQDRDRREAADRQAMEDSERRVKEFYNAPTNVVDQLNGGPEFIDFYKGVDPSYYNAFGSAVGMFTNRCTYR